MSDNHLRWIPARVDAIEQVSEQVKRFELFLPSFSRFEQMPDKAYIDVKTPSGLVRQYPICHSNLATQTIVIEVVLGDMADTASQSMYDITDKECLLEVTAPTSSQYESKEDIDFYVTFARKGVTLAVPKGVSITDVMRENNLHVNTSCEYGICGTCYTTVLSGEIIHEDTYLMDDEKVKQDCMMICVSRGKPGTTIELDL